MRSFTEADVRPHGAVQGAGSLVTDSTADLIDAPLPMHKAGLSQTATGYGARLTLRHKIQFNGKAYRLYCTCYSNAGSVWFKAKGRTIFVN
jgi:hypothetical protein